MSAVIKTDPNKRKITKFELEEHNKETDMWIAVNGKVYDLTAWVDSHPGGRDVLIDH
jgi:cytochrome b involved in lipid metabolism